MIPNSASLQKHHLLQKINFCLTKRSLKALLDAKLPVKLLMSKVCNRLDLKQVMLYT